VSLKCPPSAPGQAKEDYSKRRPLSELRSKAGVVTFFPKKLGRRGTAEMRESRAPSRAVRGDKRNRLRSPYDPIPQRCPQKAQTVDPGGRNRAGTLGIVHTPFGEQSRQILTGRSAAPRKPRE